MVSLGHEWKHSNVPLLIFPINHTAKVIVLHTLCLDQIGYELIRNKPWTYIEQDAIFAGPRLVFAFSRHTFGCEWFQ
jgi:hypothetical protein